MNSNHRRELAQNDLANWLISVYEDWIEPNAKTLSTAAIIILVLILGFNLYNRIQKSNASAAWQQYYSAMNLPDSEAQQAALQMIADSGSVISTQSRLTLAQLLLADAVNGVAIDKVKSVAKLDRAADNFRKLRADKDINIVVHANWGLAQTLETAATVRDGNDLEEAKKEYETLAKKYPNEEFGQLAAKQLAFLSRPDSVKFIERSLAKSKEAPKPEDFKVEIDKTNPFASGISDIGLDIQKALEEPMQMPKPEEPKTEENKME
ncbi:MAG: tetratricopeptide repeat protein [Planctomycetaceae bacterium]|nr:tetratricopeptide repeat protein [Planctomycetaceae bacterium]